VQGIKADPVDRLRSAGRIVTPAEYKIFLDAMQTKETRIVAFPGETGLGLHHLALLARPWVYAHSRPEIFSSLAVRDWIDGV
jgi:hypothetical protein